MRRLAVLLTVSCVAIPASAEAETGWSLPLGSLRLTPPLLLAQAEGAPAPGEQPAPAPAEPEAEPAQPQAPASPGGAPDLEFDLLGKPAQPQGEAPAVDEEAVATRRAML